MKTRTSLILAALAIIVTGAIAAEVTITLPAEKVTLRPGKGAELAQANCLICHSPDYIQTQPPMPRKFWEAEVKKMREKYGAPTPEETVPALVDYLAATYGVPDAKKP
ncbi:MAG: cytochrome c [Chthoniobacter sp.]|nr:cytochrome c [Chthoniobacter sp.]